MIADIEEEEGSLVTCYRTVLTILSPMLDAAKVYVSHQYRTWGDVLTARAVGTANTRCSMRKHKSLSALPSIVRRIPPPPHHLSDREATPVCAMRIFVPSVPFAEGAVAVLRFLKTYVIA